MNTEQIHLRWIHRLSHIAILFILLSALAVPASAELWLCPLCQEERIDRGENSEELVCPACDATMLSEDLRLPVACLCIATRPTQVLWDIFPECGLFTAEGLLALSSSKELWVPWSAVDYYIPRMRILRLTSGEELKTPYALGPTCEREEQPKILATVADSIGDWTRKGSIRTKPVETMLSSLFIVARSPAARDSARSRFIAEVEAGNHPRLPRTQPRIRRLANPTVPQSVLNDSLEVVLGVRISQRGQVLKVHRLQGSGNDDVDRAALLAAYRSAMIPGGELGVGVPCSLILHYRFIRGTVSVDGEPADPPMWEEWVEPPQP